MGVSYYAHAVIGVSVTREQLYEVEEKKERGCRHSVHTCFAFCPMCGKPTWITSKVEQLKPFVKTKFPEEGLSEVESVAGLKIFLGTRHHSDLYEEIVLGIGVTANENGAKFLHGTDLDTWKHGIRVALEPHGLWDENKFGLYSILVCSY